MAEPLVVVLTDEQRKALAAEIVAELRKDGNGHPPEEPDRLLDVEAAARVLSVKEKRLYDRARRLPFTVKLPGSRMVRFSAHGIDRFIAKGMGR